MVRKTKEDADKTRHQLLDAAEKLFQSKGVSRTSLQDIAAEAGTTRGAIYWHFKDKADLFNAMMDRVTLPLEEAKATVASTKSEKEDALDVLRRSVREALRQTAADQRTQRVFEIATLQVEYNDEMRAVRERQESMCEHFTAKASDAIGQAATGRQVDLPIPLATAAKGLHSLISGLFQNWLLQPHSFDLVQVGAQSIDTYLRGLGFHLAPLPSPDGTRDAGHSAGR